MSRMKNPARLTGQPQVPCRFMAGGNRNVQPNAMLHPVDGSALSEFEYWTFAYGIKSKTAKVVVCLALS